MKTERGRYYKGGQKTAARNGEAADGRPQFDYLMTTHRAGDLCARCREIIDASNKQERA